jgi:GAF domain-containing protein
MHDPNYDSIQETARLQEIADLDLFSENLKLLLDDLSVRAAVHLGLPNCAISIVLDEAQFFLSMHGPQTEMVQESQGTPREWSFCQHVVRDKAPFIVSNAPSDERMQDSPLVKIDGQRCYAGVPLITSKGFIIGSFCASGTEARSFSQDDIEYLRRMASKAVARMEARVGRELAIRHSQALSRIHLSDRSR